MTLERLQRQRLGTPRGTAVLQDRYDFSLSNWMDAMGDNSPGTDRQLTPDTGIELLRPRKTRLHQQ